MISNIVTQLCKFAKVIRSGKVKNHFFYKKKKNRSPSGNSTFQVERREIYVALATTTNCAEYNYTIISLFIVKAAIFDDTKSVVWFGEKLQNKFINLVQLKAEGYSTIKPLIQKQKNKKKNRVHTLFLYSSSFASCSVWCISIRYFHNCAYSCGACIKSLH